MLKLVPDMITVAFSAPLAGLKPEIDGEGNTVKADKLLTVTPLVVTEIVPEDAPAGTDVVTLVGVDEVTTAGVPLNDTMGDVLKLVPLIITTAPAAPSEGVKVEIVGVSNTLNGDPLETVSPFSVNEIVPVDAPTGTEVVILVEVEAVTTAATPLNSTTLLVGVVLKLFPEMITDAPTAPLAGLNPVIDGVGSTVKSLTLVTVTPLTVTEIFPKVAPAGTVVVMLVAVEEETAAAIPLKRTTFSVGVMLKFVPVIVTVVPSAPLLGVKLEKVGEATTIKLVGAVVMVMPLVVTAMGPDAASEGTEVVMLV